MAQELNREREKDWLSRLSESDVECWSHYPSLFNNAQKTHAKSECVGKRAKEVSKLKAVVIPTGWGRRYTIIFSSYILLNYLLFFP